MGRWAQVQLSGSNFYANELYAGSILSGGPGNEFQKFVTVWDSSTNRFHFTGSYGNAGDPDPLWFPYEGDLGLTVANASSTTRTLTIGKDRNTAGAAYLSLVASGSFGGSIPGKRFLILRPSSVNANTTLSDGGNGDIKIVNSSSIEYNNSPQARGFLTFDLGGWQGSSAAIITNGTGEISQSLNGSSQALNIGVALNSGIGGPQGGWDNVPLQATLTGIGLKIRAKKTLGASSPVIQARIINSSGTRTSSTRGKTITATTYTNYEIGGDGDLWNFPLVGGGTTFATPGGPQPYGATFRVADLTDFDATFTPSLSSTGIFRVEIWVALNASPSTPVYIEGTNTEPYSPSLVLYYYDSINDRKFSVESTNLGGRPPFEVPLDGNIRLNHNGTSFLPVRMTGSYAIGGSQPFFGYGSFSTNRIKTDIKSLDNSVLEDFDKLNPITFKYLTDLKTVEGGFIAEEVAEINPIFANYSPNYRIQGGQLHMNEPPIDDTLIPMDISERGIMAAAVKKLQYLDNEISKLNG